MQRNKFLSMLIAASLTVVPMLTLNQNVNAAKKTITIKKTGVGYVGLFDKRGKDATTIQVINGKKWTVDAHADSGKKFSYKGKPGIIKGQKRAYDYSFFVKKPGFYYQPAAYFNIGKGHYVQAQAVSSMNGRGTLILNNKSAVYNRYGKRISYQGKRTIPKYMVLNYYGGTHKLGRNDKYFYYSGNVKKRSVKSYNIKGSKYYSIGHGAYINAANVGIINGEAVFQKGGTTVTAPLRYKLKVYNYKLDSTKRTIKAGRKVRLDATKVIGKGDSASLFFRIAGTKGKKSQYLYWGDDSEYGYVLDTTDEHVGDFDVRARLED